MYPQKIDLNFQFFPPLWILMSYKSNIIFTGKSKFFKSSKTNSSFNIPLKMTGEKHKSIEIFSKIALPISFPKKKNK